MIDFLPELKLDLAKHLVDSRVLLDGFRLINEDSRKSSAYVDSNYIPFYYHLGKYVQPLNFLEVGFGLGLISGCFFKSCKSVNYSCLFQSKKQEYYSERTALKNLKSVYKNKFDFIFGKIEDIPKVDWDLVFFNEEGSYDEILYKLDYVWSNLKLDGILVLDNATMNKDIKKVFDNFHKIKNCQNFLLNTRYGTGILVK